MNYLRKRIILCLLYGGSAVAVLGIVWYTGEADTSLQPIVSKLVVGLMLLSILVLGLSTSLTKTMLAPGGISHSGPDGNRQLWPDENSQS